MSISAPIVFDRLSLARRTHALLQAASPKYGCLVAMLPSLETVIPHWAAENIKADTLVDDGIETETHCTVLYGWHEDFNAMELRRTLATVSPLALTMGNLSRFECPEYDVIKFAVECPLLVKLNRDLARQFKDKITPSEHAFKAHITAAYVKKGSNKDLTAPKIEGYKAIVQQLLYSLPEKKGRLVFDLGRASVTATLAARVTNLLHATEVPKFKYTAHPHDAPRAAATARYQTAVDDLTAHAKAIVLSKSKKKRQEIKALFLLLMLDAADDAYRTIYPALEKQAGNEISKNVASGTASKPVLEMKQLRAEAEAYARTRQIYLENFPSTVFDRLDAARQQAEADGMDDKEVRAELNRTATDIKSGQGAVVSETEGQSVYGAAEIRVLKRAGYSTKRWQTEEDERVRDSHENCQLQGAIDIDAKFANGLHYPGEAGAPPSEICNCRCWLVGGVK